MANSGKNGSRRVEGSRGREEGLSQTPLALKTNHKKANHQQDRKEKGDSHARV